MFSRLYQSVLIRIAYIYFQIRAWQPVWFYVVNRKNRHIFEAHQSGLSAVQQRIVSDLTRDGIAVANMDELFPGSDMMIRFQTYVTQEVAEAETKTHKSFLKNVWDAVPIIDMKNPFVPLALSDMILTTVNEYMRMCSYFFYLTLNITTPVKPGSEAIQSQRWHGDPEDKIMCKVFLYLTDVDEGSGPFMYVLGTQYGGRWRHLFHDQPPRGMRAPDRPINEFVPESDMKLCTGKAGTIIFCDTSGYHRGGYATKRERIMLTLGYCSKASVYPLRFQFTDSFREDFERTKPSPAVLHALAFSRGKLTRYFFRKIKPNFKYGA